MTDFDLLGTGRIVDIIKYLKVKHDVNSIRQLTPPQKLDVLCLALQINYEQFDSIIAENPQVLRTIKGHVFEVVFEYLITQNGYKIEEVGGDSDIDCIINSKTLQLKAPYEAGTTNDVVQYKTHKTHGPKSEGEDIQYYHSVTNFADILVGLISYSPLTIVFLDKTELPTHPKDAARIASPFKIRWKEHPGLNAFERINVKNINLSPTLYINSESELLPRSTKILNVNTDIILNAILSESNFRIWDMSIRGFAREKYFKDLLKDKNIKQLKPTECKRTRGDKSDLVLINKSNNQYVYFQIKGVSINYCVFNGNNSVVGTETQLTRGRVNDHPTQSRLYLTTDYDYLIIGIDPCISQKYALEVKKTPNFKWEYYSIPTTILEVHKTYSNRIKSAQIFNYLDLQNYRINEDWFYNWGEEITLL